MTTLHPAAERPPPLRRPRGAGCSASRPASCCRSPRARGRLRRCDPTTSSSRATTRTTSAGRVRGGAGGLLAALARPALAAARQPRRPGLPPLRVPGADRGRGRRARQVRLQRRRVALPRARHAGPGRGRRADRGRPGGMDPASRCGEHSPGRALFMHHPPVELGLAWLDRIGIEDKELLHGAAPRRRADQARLLRPRPPRVVAPGRSGRGGDDAVDRAAVQPQQRRGGVRRGTSGVSARRARRRRVLDEGRAAARSPVLPLPAVGDG